MSMDPPNRIEVVTSLQRRRRGTASGKVRIVEETFAPGMMVSMVARQHGVAPNQPPIGGARQPDCSPAAARTWCRRRIMGRCRTRFASFIGCSARRPSRPRFSTKSMCDFPSGRRRIHIAGAVAPNTKDGSETSVLFPLPTSVVYPFSVLALPPRVVGAYVGDGACINRKRGAKPAEESDSIWLLAWWRQRH